MQNFPSPRLPAFLKLLHDFQKACLPASTSLVRSANQLLQGPEADPSFHFAVGSSSDPSLARAVVECVKQIKESLGPSRAPDLCTLHVTAEPYRSHNIRFAPAVKANRLFATHARWSRGFIV